MILCGISPSNFQQVYYNRYPKLDQLIFCKYLSCAELGYTIEISLRVWCLPLSILKTFKLGLLETNERRRHSIFRGVLLHWQYALDLEFLYFLFAAEVVEGQALYDIIIILKWVMKNNTKCQYFNARNTFTHRSCYMKNSNKT